MPEFFERDDETMMRHRIIRNAAWRWIFLVAFLAVAARAGEATTARHAFRVEKWSGGAYYDGQPKTFYRCAATTPAAAGNFISYSVNRQFHWSVTLYNPIWNFAKGAKQHVYIQISNSPGSLSATATALSKSILELHTSDPLSFLAKLRIAQRLRVAMGGVILEFPLQGGEETLSALTHCVLRSTDSYRNMRSKNLMFNAHDAALKSPAHNEAAALVSNIIAYSRVRELQVLPTTVGVSSLPLDAAWKVGLVKAGVTIVEAPTSIEQVAQPLIANALRACQGGFFFVQSPSIINETPIARVFVSCQTTETTASSYHLIIPRPKAGHYILTIASTGNSFFGVAHKAADAYEARLREIIMLAISKLN